MPRSGRGGRYHHGDLRAALIETAVELIGERGVRSFSLAEASRRLGVAVSAPYAHFADRDELLAAVAVQAGHALAGELLRAEDPAQPPAARLAAMAAAFVRFAARHRPLFEVLYEAGLDQAHPHEVETARKLTNDAFLSGVTPLTGGDSALAEDLAAALQAAALGHAMRLLDRGPGVAGPAVDRAAGRAARAAQALVESRQLLGQSGGR